MILSREDIEGIADNVIKDFREVTGIVTMFTTIDQLAVDYLGLRVTFEKLSNDDRFCGVTAYEDTNFKVQVDNIDRIITIKKNQIILDSDFVEVGKVRELCGKRRFTLAHEVAHQILFSLENEEVKATIKQKYSTRKAHTISQLKTAEDWNEWQANALGAALLMPRVNVREFMVQHREYVLTEYPTFFQPIMLSSELVVRHFCQCFHVSKSAGIIRLKQLGYLTDEKTNFEKEVCYA